jgi:O-antigen/teichoic acid export membrane protein
MQNDRTNVVRHAAAYLLARGVPGILSFLAIPLFTRLLDPQGYGNYALAATTAALINALAFQWVRLSFVRYLPAAKGTPQRLKSTVLTCQLVVVGVAGLMVLAAYVLPTPPAWRSAAGICWLVIAVQPLFELFCEQARAMIQPRYYMGLQLSRVALTTGLGAVFILCGMGWWGPLLGIAVGNLLPALYAYRHDWAQTRLGIDREVLNRICAYGIPLSLTVGLSFVISSSDRYIIAYYLGNGAAGVYSVAVDFTSQTLTLLLMTISLAIVPLAMRSWENDDPEGARVQMRHNATLLLAVGIPAVVGLMLLAPSIAHSFLGKSFRVDAARVIPIVALGTFLAGYKAYYLDTAFQFAHRTIYQVWIVLIAAVVNVALNLLVMRCTRLGITGAAGASVIAYLIAMILTAFYGRRHFALPFPSGDFLHVAVASAVMALALCLIRDYRGAVALTTQIVTGGAVYAAILFAFNFQNLRTAIVQRVVKRVTAPVAAVAVQ